LKLRWHECGSITGGRSMRLNHRIERGY